MGEDEESVKACLVSILAVVAAAGCSTTRLSEDSRRSLWVLWAVHQNYIDGDVHDESGVRCPPPLGPHRDSGRDA